MVEKRSAPNEFNCRATAATLRALCPLMAASQAVAVVAGVWLSAGAYPWLIASLAAWAGGLYLAVRVYLDAELLELLADDPERHPAQLDHYLVQAGLRRQPIQRNLDERCQGARRWGNLLVLALVLQLALMLVDLVRRPR